MNGLLEKNIILVRIYNQQFQATISLMVFDFQGIYIYIICISCIFTSIWFGVFYGKHMYILLLSGTSS